MNQGLSATIELQTGTRVDQTLLTANKIDELIKTKYPEVNIISTSPVLMTRVDLHQYFRQEEHIQYVIV